MLAMDAEPLELGDVWCIRRAFPLPLGMALQVKRTARLILEL
jgi:predicted solute-binding protein